MTSRDDKRQNDAFVDGVLSRTTGQACERALGQLDDLMENRLQDLDRHLVQSHLEHCEGCRSVAVTVGWLQPLLPDMAEVEVSSDFLSGVLARTSRVEAPRNLSVHPSGMAGVMDRVGRWWQERILRPSFAPQLAYAATVILVVLVYTTPLRSVPNQALQLISAGPTELPVVGPIIDNSSRWLEDETNQALESSRSRVSNKKTSLANDLRNRISRTAPSRHALIRHLDNAAQEAQARSVTGVSREMVGALQTSREAWSLWWHATSKNSELNSDTTSGP